MANVHSFRDLLVWQRAMELVDACYHLTRGLPSEERYGLRSQIRRAAASIPANIAEGHGRYTRGEYLRGLRIASGSLKELETHCLMAARLHLVTPAELGPTMQLADEVGRMIYAIRRRLEPTSRPPKP